MYRTTRVAAFLMAIAIPPALAAGQGNGSGDGQGRRSYQEHDRGTNTTFTATTDASGNAALTLTGGDFVLEKVIAHNGDATLRLSQGKDVVTIALSQNGFQIARGQKAIQVDPRSQNYDGFDVARSLLLGSQAVRSFKRLVAALEERDESEEDGPLALSALIDGAIVQLLDGDVDAPRRIGKRITRKHRASLRVVKSARAPGVFVDCVGNYQIALLSAYGQFESCFIESTGYSWWSRSFVYRMCEWEWAIRSQQYVWQFIGCFMLPW
jgi:hypothetical protein